MVVLAECAVIVVLPRPLDDSLEVVQQAPPPMIVERRPPPPSMDYVWIDGYWQWGGREYQWVGGHYVQPPEPNVIWVAPRYDHDAHGYRYSPGQWRKQEQGNGHGHEGGHD
jgi:hypothetical protein